MTSFRRLDEASSQAPVRFEGVWWLLAMLLATFLTRYPETLRAGWIAAGLAVNGPYLVEVVI